MLYFRGLLFFNSHFVLEFTQMALCHHSLYIFSVWYDTVRTNNHLFAHSLADGHFLSYFQILTTTDNAAINISVRAIWFPCAQISKRYEPGSSPGGLQGTCIVNFAA